MLEVASETELAPKYQRVPPRNEIFSPAAPSCESAVSNADSRSAIQVEPAGEGIWAGCVRSGRVRSAHQRQFELTTSPLLPVILLEPWMAISLPSHK